MWKKLSVRAIDFLLKILGEPATEEKTKNTNIKVSVHLNAQKILKDDGRPWPPKNRMRP